MLGSISRSTRRKKNYDGKFYRERCINLKFESGYGNEFSK